MLKNISIGMRIYSILIASVIVMALLVGAFYFASHSISISSGDLARKQMFSLQEDRIKDITLASANGLGTLVQGKTRDEQIKIIRDFASKSRFDVNDTGYFFTYEGTVNISHPVNTSLQGKDLGGAVDSDNVRYVAELDKAAKRGGDFVSFIYPKPNGEIAAKLAYATFIPGTTFWMGTGVYTDNVDVLANELQNSMISQSNEVELYLVLGVLLVILIAMPICIKLISSITRPISELTKISAQVAEGDLSVKVVINEADAISKNETNVMSNAIGKMIEALKEKIKDTECAMLETQKNSEKIQEALNTAAIAEQNANAKTEHMLNVANLLDEVASQLASTSNELTQTITECEKGATKQASEMSKTSLAMDSMSHTVREVAQSASEASNASIMTGDKAHTGGTIAKEAINSMQEVQSLTTRLMDDMQRLDLSAKSIDQVMGVISEIADQTNLLALNAAIEAARAGEAGRGFAVVADEVRKLAEKTMASTSEVAKIISEIQQSASQSLTQTNASFKAIEKATDLVRQSGETLNEITGMTKDSASQVQSIASVAEEQSVATRDINDAISQVNSIALETERSMNLAASSVSALASQAHELTKLTRDMKNS